jgi:hypothetical protein
MLAIHLTSLGLFTLQSKKYFEEFFHLGSTIHEFSRANHSSCDMRRSANYEDSSCLSSHISRSTVRRESLVVNEERKLHLHNVYRTDRFLLSNGHLPVL